MNNKKVRRINFKPAYLIILLVTMIVFQIISDRSMFPNVPLRMQIQDSILSGQMEAPYQYRIMEPVLGYSVQQIVRHFISNPIKIHTLSYQIILFICLSGIFLQFYIFLKRFFTDQTCMLGVLLLGIVIPLGITSYWEDGDYYTLFFYVWGLNLIFDRKDYYLPLLILIATINRTQIVFLLTFYVIFLFVNKELFKKKSFLIIGLSMAAFIIAFYSLRFYFGFKISPYPVMHEITSNFSSKYMILQLWTEEVFVFLFLSILAYKKSSRFFQLSLLSLILYVIFFFFNSIMSQLAKFLPAYLIMIPMSLQVLTGESTVIKGESGLDKSNY
jgi:hypothetical protein